MAWSVGTVEYTDCFSAEGLNSPNECPGYDTKQSGGEAPVKLELWGIRSTPLLPSLPGPPRPGVLAPDNVLSMGQIEQNSVLILNWIVWNRTVLHLNEIELNCIPMLNWIDWNRTVLTFKLRTYTKLNCLK